MKDKLNVKGVCNRNTINKIRIGDNFGNNKNDI